MSKSTQMRTLRVIAFLAAVVFLQALSPRSLLADECEQACHDTYVTCYYDYCDQRGDCSYCWNDYQSCVSYCPQTCVDPVSVRDYSTGTVLSQSYYPYYDCFLGRGVFGGVTHRLSYRLVRIRDWRETRNCDGSTTQTLLRTYNREEVCWQQQTNACSPWRSNDTPYPTCFPW
jgi:hypothetical protein